MSNLQTRIITALLLIVIVLSATWMGGVIFRLLALLTGAAIYHEWQNLTQSFPTILGKWVGWLSYMGVACCLLVPAESVSQNAWLIFATIAAGALVSAVLGGEEQAFWRAGGFFYALAAPATLSLIRASDSSGLGYVLFLYAIVWSTDSAAYFSGRVLGGPRLAPGLSPNKTWSGAAGGVLIALVAALLIAWIRPEFDLSQLSNVFALLLFALVLSIVSQAGDIGESWVKRHFNAKDSGFLLPGHGGFMDRVDGLVAACIVFYLFQSIFAII